MVAGVGGQVSRQGFDRRRQGAVALQAGGFVGSPQRGTAWGRIAADCRRRWELFVGTLDQG